MSKQRAEVEKLADELFSAIQRSQGFFHISDGETFPTKARLFSRIRDRLKYGRKAVRIMEAFLRKHKQL